MTPGEKRLVVLARLENDHFARGVVLAAYTAVEQMERSGASDAADDLANALAELIKHYPPTIAQVQVAVETLQDILNLPVFKHRYDLYGAWVFTQLVAAWPPGAELRVVDGVLRFPFKATVLAELLDTEPPACIVCELRTPLANPKGKSRKAAIQPDYSVLVGEARPTSSPLPPRASASMIGPPAVARDDKQQPEPTPSLWSLFRAGMLPSARAP